MHLINKINAINGIMKQADEHVLTFQTELQIGCIPNCSLCCTKSDIETTVSEFLPAAYELCRSGEYTKILENINERANTLCAFYNAFSNEGFCSLYVNRGLVCRLFGFSSKTNKTGIRIPITCKPIKNTPYFNMVQEKFSLAPEMSDYYLKLYGVDPILSVLYLPINQAIKKALEIVLLHFYYTKKPA